MQNTQTLKADIISALDSLPADNLRLLAEFAAFLQAKSGQSVYEMPLSQKTSTSQENRWAQISQRIQRHPPLHGVGEFVRECSQEFREDFALTPDEE